MIFVLNLFLDIMQYSINGLTGLLLIIALPFVVIILNSIYEKKGYKIGLRSKNSPHTGNSLKETVRVGLAFNGKHWQEGILLVVENGGLTSVNLEAPIVLFHFLFFRRKFRLKSSVMQPYPFYLSPGCSCNIALNLSGFYSRIPSLRWLPFLTVKVKESSGHTLTPVSLFLKPTWLP